MPFKSEKQKRFFYVRMNGKKADKEDGDLSPEVARKFIEESPKKERFSKLKSRLKKGY